MIVEQLRKFVKRVNWRDFFLGLFVALMNLIVFGILYLVSRFGAVPVIVGAAVLVALALYLAKRRAKMR